MKRSTLCLVDTEAQADAVAAELKSAGFSENDISVLFPDKGSTRDFAHKKETKMPEASSARRLDSWPVSVPWPSLAWDPLLLQDQSWRRSAAGPLGPESAV
jgi:hypothetical protein